MDYLGERVESASEYTTDGASIVRVFLVKLEDGEGHSTIYDSDFCPKVGDLGRDATGEEVYCTKVRMEYWEGERGVTAVYATYGRQREAPAAEFIGQPLNVPDRVVQGTVSTTKVASRDAVNGQPFLNSVGIPFDPATLPDVEVTRYRIHVIQNRASFQYGEAQEFTDTVNTFAFPLDGTTILQGACKHAGITGEPKWDNGEKYTEVVHTLDIRAGGWKEQILDQGRVFFNSVTGKYKAFTDENGNQLQDPILFDGHGEPIPGQIVPNPPGPSTHLPVHPSAAVYMPLNDAWNLYEKRDFNTLGFPP